MENLVKEKVLKIFDLKKVQPGDVIQFHKFGDAMRTATENALVVETCEEAIVAIIYKPGIHQDFGSITFHPDDEGIKITKIIKPEY